MKDKPLILGVLVGFSVLLIIAGISLLVKLNKLTETYNTEISHGMSLQKTLENLSIDQSKLQNENKELVTKNTALEEENKRSKDEINLLNSQIENFKLEMAKLEKLKEKLEDNLKDELMKNEELNKNDSSSKNEVIKGK